MRTSPNGVPVSGPSPAADPGLSTNLDAEFRDDDEAFVSTTEGPSGAV